MSPQRNGQDSPALQQVLRHFGLHVAEERMQSGEAVVLRGDRDMPNLRQIIEEHLHKASVALRQRKSFQGDAAHVATELQQLRDADRRQRRAEMAAERSIMKLLCAVSQR